MDAIVSSGRRRNFDWIIDGFGIPNRVQGCVIEPHENPKFKIVVARHEITSQVYIGNVERFLQGAASAENLLGGLRLRSAAETERHSRLHSPSTHPILLSLGQIARGGFGVVTRQWDVSTGKEYVYKAPILGSTQNVTVWNKEIDIMRRISHDHIVRLRFWVNPPDPLLCLEYMPYGNLEDQHGMAPFTYNESLVVFHQSLLALEYLHGQLVTHRDLKPENILVQCRGTDRNPRCLHVKLSDFGLSGVGSLYTICGSKTYWPPEIAFDTSSQKYTNAVDIWSLGVVLLRLAYSLPDPGSGMIGMEWCQEIVKQVGRWGSKGLINVLRQMLVIDANARPSAATCLYESYSLLMSSQVFSVVPTSTSYAAGHRPTLDQIPQEDGGGEGTEERFADRPQAPSNREMNLLRRRRLPESYQILEWNHVEIAYVPSERLVNATHLLKLKNMPRAKLVVFFRRYPQTWKTVRSAGPVISGTYIRFDDAPRFCHHFGLSQDPVDQLLSIPVAESSGVGSTSSTIRVSAFKGKVPDDVENNPGVVASGSREPDISETSDDEPGAVDEIPGANAENPGLYVSDSTSAPRSVPNHLPLETGDAHLAEAEHVSRYTERSYANGSYLAPPNRSFEQLLNFGRGVVDGKKE
ncbi:hypothetical protein ANO14919_100860 [Xylariales sp. No.14919]|nr:hypothetical protein ANO14919_100860 [Xylariales sp. No.14919]